MHHQPIETVRAVSAPSPPLGATSFDGYPSEPCWYVVEAYEHSVESAYLRLAVAGLKVWMPVDLKRQSNRTRSRAPRRDLRIPRFGRYFFVHCRMSAELQHAIDHTPCVAGLLVAVRSDRPAPIPVHVIEWLRNPPKRADPDSFGFVVGDLVRVMDGPFAGFDAKVEDVDKRGVLRVTVDIFGRPTPIAIEVGHVEMVLPAKSRSIIGVKSHRAAKAAPVRKHY